MSPKLGVYPKRVYSKAVYSKGGWGFGIGSKRSREKSDNEMDHNCNVVTNLIYAK